MITQRASPVTSSPSFASPGPRGTRTRHTVCTFHGFHEQAYSLLDGVMAICSAPSKSQVTIQSCNGRRSPQAVRCGAGSKDDGTVKTGQ